MQSTSQLVLNNSNKDLFHTYSFIDNQWIEGENSQTFRVVNPADNSLVADVACLTQNQSKQAINSAKNAFDSWSKLLPQERSVYLSQWNQLLQENKEDLALLITLEQGKSLNESLDEIDYASSFIEYYAEETKRANLEGITSHLKNAEMELWLEPIGVVALITPWNFPSAMITRKAAAALAAGCSVLVHPSRETPLSALALAALTEQAGFPKGVFNVLTGYHQDVVEPLVNSDLVRAISFTGSTRVGKLLYEKCAPTVKKMILELGGNAPFIVFDDADIDYAVNQAISAKFTTSGQDCLAANRFYIHQSIYSDFYTKFTDQVKKLKVGKGIKNNDIGPLINQSAINQQLEYIDDAIKKGAKILTGGKVHSAGSLFFEPTVLIDVDDIALVFIEEIFGPIAAISSFSSEDEVIARANDTEYGLVAYIHTQNAHKIYRLSRELEFGMIAINRTKVTGAPIPFGGVKKSGLGKEGSSYGMKEFCEIKYVCRNYL